MRITKRQLKRIIREAYEMSRKEVENFLTTKAADYHKDRALAQSGPGAIRELLQDDVMDNISGNWSPRDFEDLINDLSAAPPKDSDFKGPDPSTHRRLRQQTRAQGGYSGRGAWKSRNSN